jgi:hypothetical protein
MAQRWYKGNTHTHTTYSDGDSPPEVVVDWYAEHGYDFLFLTDHNAIIPDDHLARLQRGGLAIWQGEEVTMAAVHVNGLGLRETIVPKQPGSSAREREVTEGRAERIRWAVERIRAQDGVAHVNHPNFLWTLSIDDLLEAGDFGLMEVANGHNLVGNLGDAEHLSTEALWDRLLTAERKVWGVASDDAHHFRHWGDAYANPGRGWLRVEADSDRMSDILEGMRAGHFYASSGLELAAYEADRSALRLELADDAAHFDLIGHGGDVLDRAEGTVARFSIPAGLGGYVRVRATDLVGRQLWTQPLFL